MTLKHHILAASYPLLEIFQSISSYARLRQKGRLRVLVYHDIAPHEITKFYSQMAWLLKKWTFVDADVFAAMMSGNVPIVGDNLLLTFDDGFSSNLIVAEKVLKPLVIPAIFFVVSGFVELTELDACHSFISKGIRSDLDPSMMPNHWRSMNWSDLEYLLDSGHTIGAHTATHARLSNLSEKQELEAEIIESADKIESRLGASVDHFAFTFGDFGSLSCDALSVAKRRFKHIYTSLRGDNALGGSPLLISRDTIAPVDTNYLIGSFLAGGADFRYRQAKEDFKRYL